MASGGLAWFSILLLTLISSPVRAGENEKEFVLTLDRSNFTDVVSKHNFIVVEFFAPWCGHCQALAPEYEKAASELSKIDPPIILAKVDVSNESNQAFIHQFLVQGLPTIKILRNGGKSTQDYNGPREADGIVAYLKKQTGPASFEIKSAEDAAVAVREDSVSIVGVFPELSGEEFETFLAIAEKLRSNYEFSHTLDAKLLPSGDSSVSGPLIRLFKPYDEQVVDFKDFEAEALEKFMKDNSFPLLAIFDSHPDNHPYVIKYLQDEGAIKAMLYMNMADDESTESFKSKLRELAKAHRGQAIRFLIGDATVAHEALEYLGVEDLDSQLPLLFILDDDKKYLKQNVEVDQIESWLNDYKNGKLSVHIKSEPIPKENNELVKIVVADTLNEMVLNTDKNVLLEFYSPGCGACKEFAPVLEEVAVSFQNDPAVVIAKIDIRKNDVPADKFQAMKLPTLYLKTASGKLVEYTGDKTKEDIISFVESNKDFISSQVKDEL